MQTVNVIVPYRDRLDDLKLLYPALRETLIAQKIQPHFYVIEQQSFELPFNKGLLINAGVAESHKDGFSDNCMMNDVDIFPLDHQVVRFNVKENTINHYFGHDSCLGGELTFNYDAYKKANGYSNQYWGWGWEDTDFRARVLFVKLRIDRSQFHFRYQTDQFHDRLDPKWETKSNKKNRALLTEKLASYRESIENIWLDGLKDCNYSVLNREYLFGARDIEKLVIEIHSTPKDNLLDNKNISRSPLSLICSTYNAKNWVPGYINALNKIQLRDFEVVFVDANSIDETVELLTKTELRSDIRRRIIRCSMRVGLYEAWNIGIRAASSQYVMNLNIDDRLYPLTPQIYLEFARKYQEIDVFYGPCDIVEDPDHRTIVSKHDWPEFSLETLMKACMIGPFPMLKRRTAISYGLFDTSYVASGDYAFWVKLASNGCSFKRIDYTTGSYYRNFEGISLREEHRALVKRENARLRAEWTNGSN